MQLDKASLRTKNRKPSLMCPRCRAETSIEDLRISEYKLRDVQCSGCGEHYRWMDSHSAFVSRSSLAEQRLSVPNIIPFRRSP